MTPRLEWRHGPAGDILVIIDADGHVGDALAADASLISAFLTTMHDIGLDRTASIPVDGRSHESWGDLVLSRASSGEVIEVDPELYWDRIHRLYRSRGVDFDSQIMRGSDDDK